VCINVAGLGDYENRISLPEELLTMNNVASLPYLGSATVKTIIAVLELCSKI
jgi:lactate dehydrogenase-like 2-hydroxyacid dehydrogenase